MTYAATDRLTSLRLSWRLSPWQEARQLRALAALAAQINKSDRSDARGIAQMMRVGLYRPAHVKTLGSQKRRMLLTSRQLLQTKALGIDLPMSMQLLADEVIE
jgi:hypothetical protein